MNILIIVSELPFPAHKNGTATTLYNLIMQWNKEHNLEIFYYNSYDQSAEKVFSSYNIKTINRDLTSKKINIFGKIGRYYFVKPRNAFIFDFSKGDIINIKYYNLVIMVGFTSIFLYDHLLLKNDVKIVYFEIDSSLLLYKRYLKAEKSILKKMYYYIQFKIIENIESKYYSKFNKIFFVSEVDKEYCIQKFKKNVSTAKFENIKNGVDLYETKSAKVLKNKNSINIGFSGNYAYKPNKIAASFILEKILYKLLIYNEDIYLHIIGKNPTEDMFSYQKKYPKNVIITGFINNIDEYISRMDLYISPLFVGTGMKNKILQAMNLGIPLICSRVSAEGIFELQNRINCIICDSLDVKEWIDNIIYLLKNSELMEKFSKETRLIIKKNYTWEKIARDFINKCKFL